MEMLYKISIEPNPIKRSVRSQIVKNRPRESHLPHLERDFSTKRVIRSTWSQKIFHRSLNGLSTDVHLNAIHLKCDRNIPSQSVPDISVEKLLWMNYSAEQVARCGTVWDDRRDLSEKPFSHLQPFASWGPACCSRRSPKMAEEKV